MPSAEALAVFRQKQVLVVAGCPADAGPALAQALAAAGRSVTTWSSGASAEAAGTRDVLLVPALEALVDGDADQGPLLRRVMECEPTVIAVACSAAELANAEEHGVFRKAGGASVRMDLHLRLLSPAPVAYAEAVDAIARVFGPERG